MPLAALLDHTDRLICIFDEHLCVSRIIFGPFDFICDVQKIHSFTLQTTSYFLQFSHCHSIDKVQIPMFSGGKDVC